MNDLVGAVLFGVVMLLACAALIGPQKMFNPVLHIWAATASGIVVAAKCLHWYGSSRHETQVLQLASIVEYIGMLAIMCWGVAAAFEWHAIRKRWRSDHNQNRQA